MIVLAEGAFKEIEKERLIIRMASWRAELGPSQTREPMRGSCSRSQSQEEQVRANLLRNLAKAIELQFPVECPFKPYCHSRSFVMPGRAI